MVSSRNGYAVLALWITGLGLFFLLSPSWWYGPSWSYFATHGQMIIPAGGFGLGLCLTCIGLLQIGCVWRQAYRVLSALFFVSGFVLWTAGLLLGAEGLQGHEGLMEAPLFCSFGMHKFVISVSLRNRLHNNQGP